MDRSRGAGGIEPEIHFKFNYNQLLRYSCGYLVSLHRIIAATALYLNGPLISRDRKIQLSTVNTIW